MHSHTDIATHKNLNILLVDDCENSLRKIKHMLTEIAPESDIHSYNPAKKGNPDDNYNWQQHQILMLDTCTKRQGFFKCVKQNTRNLQAPYTVMLSVSDKTIDHPGEDISGVSEQLMKSTLCPEILGEMLGRAVKNTRGNETEDTATPIASHQPFDSIIAYGRSAFETPFSDIDIANGHANIKGYQIKQLIGVGGMSSVYLAIRESDNRQVAIKTLKPRSLQDDRVIDRFIREYQIGRSINHKNIIKIHDQRFLDDFAYIVMDHLPGKSLNNVIRYPIGPRQAIKYALNIASALIGLHDMGVVHRDIKPSNFHLNEYNQLVLLDFGVSKISSEDTELTQHGEPIGTPQFMSPEQILEKPVDERSDLYSLGVILYKMLTGNYPYRSIDTIDLMYKHVYLPPPVLPFKLLGLEKIVSGLLEKEPRYRYQTAQQVYNDLVETLMKCNRYILGA